MTIRFYLAGRMAWSTQIETVARKIEGVGLGAFVICSKWHRWSPSHNMDLKTLTTVARGLDIVGTTICDAFVFFKRPPKKPVRLSSGDAARAGRYIELGMALALRKRIYIIGDRGNDTSVFEEDPSITWFKSPSTFLEHLSAVAAAAQDWKEA